MGLIVAIFLPLLAALLCWLKPLRKIAWGSTVICLSISFAFAVTTAGQVLRNGRAVAIPGWFEADGLSALVILLVSFVCTLAAIFAGGYMHHGSHQTERLWWFYCNYNLLVFALIVVPGFASPNLVWVGVELITLFAILLVGFESTPSALEAAWKYAILTLMGAPISLLGFFVLYWAYRGSGGGAVETRQGLYAMSSTMPPNLLKFSFLMVFVGFGTKVGLAPMHIWLPDAHSQAPTPICAVLSGIKTTVPLYAILRFLSIILASPEARIGNWMVVFGLFSVGIAAFLLLQVRDYKRMFAFSTVEHMGIILVAAGFATHAGDYGARFPDAEPLHHEVSMFLHGRYGVTKSRHAPDQRGAGALPDFAIHGWRAAALLAGDSRRSSIPNFFKRILDSVRGSSIRAQRCRCDSRSSYRGCVYSHHAAGERHAVWRARVNYAGGAGAVKLPHGRVGGRDTGGSSGCLHPGAGAFSFGTGGTTTGRTLK
jgi:formate hydrogenlyase subunit 3/multisubunit Na+/H+ antiporter MnhD subunit